jgi:hypothetical protein
VLPVSASTALQLRIQVFLDVMLCECFYSGVVTDTGVLVCDAAVLGVSTAVQLSIQVFWDVMLHCWVFLQWWS